MDHEKFMLDLNNLTNEATKSLDPEVRAGAVVLLTLRGAMLGRDVMALAQVAVGYGQVARIAMQSAIDQQANRPHHD